MLITSDQPGPDTEVRHKDKLRPSQFRTCTVHILSIILTKCHISVATARSNKNSCSECIMHCGIKHASFMVNHHEQPRAAQHCDSTQNAGVMMRPCGWQKMMVTRLPASSVIAEGLSNGIHQMNQVLTSAQDSALPKQQECQMTLELHAPPAQCLDPPAQHQGTW